MASAKTTKKKAPSKSKATQAKGKENAALTAALQTTKKNALSKSKATQAKGKEIAASTAALQAAKKKNQLRKDSVLGMSYLELNDSPQCLDIFILSMPRIRRCFGQYKQWGWR
jgi:hypothetical protein